VGAPTVPTMTDTLTEAAPIRDFTRARKRLLFRIDEDVFEAAPALPGAVLAQFATRFSGIDEKTTAEQQLSIFTDALSLVLLPDSYARFQKRFEDLEQPIELDQASDVVTWLMEEYGERPTQLSSPSSDGPPSPAPGTSSTDAAQPAVSIPVTSQPTGS
jgi:hypothetical protein